MIEHSPIPDKVEEQCSTEQKHPQDEALLPESAETTDLADMPTENSPLVEYGPSKSPNTFTAMSPTSDTLSNCISEPNSIDEDGNEVQLDENDVENLTKAFARLSIKAKATKSFRDNERV